MSNCTCNDCAARVRPPRVAMTLLQSDTDRVTGEADREIRAAIVGHVLIVSAYDRVDDEWFRDPEYGVALDRDGVEALRRLLTPAGNASK